MRIVERTESFVFEAPRWRLVAALLLAMLLKTGVWYIPNIGGSRLIALDPFVNPFDNPDAHALYWSWLGPFLAWLVGATGERSFIAFHALFSAGFTALMVGALLRRLPDEAARVALVVWALLPVSATAWFWISTDSLTLLLMACVLATWGLPILAPPLGLLLGTQHFEQALLGFGALLAGLALRRLVDPPPGEARPWTSAAGWLRWLRGGDPRHVLLVLAGIVAGKVLLVALFRAWGVQVNSGRTYWLLQHLPMLLGQFFYHLHAVLWSVLGLGWLVAVRYAEAGQRSLPFFLPLAGLLLLLPISGDQTRVLAVATFPLVASFWLFDPTFLAGLGRRFVAWLVIAWLVVPWGWVWGGTPWWSAFPYDVAFLLNRAFGWFDVPADPWMWPFGG